MAIKTITIPLDLWERMKGKSHSRTDTLIASAIRSGIVDEWAMMDGIESSGDKCFTPKNEAEEEIWKYIRSDIKRKISMRFTTKRNRNPSFKLNK